MDQNKLAEILDKVEKGELSVVEAAALIDELENDTAEAEAAQTEDTNIPDAETCETEDITAKRADAAAEMLNDLYAAIEDALPDDDAFDDEKWEGADVPEDEVRKEAVDAVKRALDGFDYKQYFTDLCSGDELRRIGEKLEKLYAGITEKAEAAAAAWNPENDDEEPGNICGDIAEAIEQLIEETEAASFFEGEDRSSKGFSFDDIGDVINKAIDGVTSGWNGSVEKLDELGKKITDAVNKAVGDFDPKDVVGEDFINKVNSTVAIAMEKFSAHAAGISEKAGAAAQKVMDDIQRTEEKRKADEEKTGRSVYRGSFARICSGDFNQDIEDNLSGVIRGDMNGNIGGDINGVLGGDMLGNIRGSVNGAVKGDISGSVGGDIRGSVQGDIIGPIGGNINGVVGGDVEGGIGGSIRGIVKGDVSGDIGGDVSGSVKGDIEGNVHGNISGIVSGDVEGDIHGVVKGRVEGDIEGSVGGIIGSRTSEARVCGDIEGDIKGDVNEYAVIEGDVEGNIEGSMHGRIEGTLEGDIMGDFSGYIGVLRGRIHGENTGTIGEYVD